MSKPSVSRIAWILEHWKPYTSVIPLILLLSCANAAIAVAYPLLFKSIINGLNSSATPALLVRYTAILCCVGVAHFLAYATMQFARAKLNLSFEFGVRVRAFRAITALGPSFFSKFRTGDIVTRLMDDVTDKLSWYLCSGIFRVFEALLIILTCLALMLSISPKLTLVAAGPLPLLIVIFVFSASKLHRRYDVVQQSISQLNDDLETCFSGIRIVKSFTATRMQQQTIFAAIEGNRAAEVRAVRWQTVMDTLWGNIWQLGIVAVLFVGGEMVMNDEITLGDLVAFDYFVLLLVWPMFDIGQFLVRGKLSAVSIDRVSELEEFAPDIKTQGPPIAVCRPGDALPVDHPQQPQAKRVGDLTFDSVTHRYSESDIPALSSVSWVAKSGGLTALVGETGAGKSTALALIPRLIDPESGAIRIGATDLCEVDLVTYRQSLGYAPQEPLLLSGTILENIRFGRDWVQDTDVATAIRISQLAADVADWPAGLETVVGSRGVRLSGGQKQRVALARAIAGRPKILLLDDCTAALDASTEDAVWRALKSDLPGCTIVLVTHRPATLQRADQIVVFARGEVVEKGCFADLNVAGTHFHELYVQWKLRDHLE